MSEPLAVIITGVTGAGKTTVGRALADRLGWAFHDADDLHGPENIERMRRGEPLTDALRAPWLEAVRKVIERAVTRGEPAVVACSALKAEYRARLAGGLQGLRFVLLTAPREVLYARVAERRGHFAPPALLESQLEALEPPADALTVDARLDADAIVRVICESLGLRRSDV